MFSLIHESIKIDVLLFLILKEKGVEMKKMTMFLMLLSVCMLCLTGCGDTTKSEKDETKKGNVSTTPADGAPGGDVGAPGDDASLPGGDAGAPGDEASLPGGDEASLPGGDEASIPSGDEASLPGGDLGTPDAGGAPSDAASLPGEDAGAPGADKGDLGGDAGVP